MTRFGVMKHLKVLEEAGLVVTKRRGREKLHFLNPVPIRLVHDRWVSKYAEPWAASAHRAQERPGGGGRWRRCSRSTSRRRRSGSGRRSPTAEHAARSTTSASDVESDWTPRLELRGPSTRSAGGAIAEGENLEVDPPRRLVQSFTALWSDDVKAEGTSRVTWEIEQVEDSCRLTVTHDQLREGANDELYGGWPMILSGLKTLLETGEQLTTPGSLMYADA